MERRLQDTPDVCRNSWSSERCTANRAVDCKDLVHKSEVRGAKSVSYLGLLYSKHFAVTAVDKSSFLLQENRFGPASEKKWFVTGRVLLPWIIQ